MHPNSTSNHRNVKLQKTIVLHYGVKEAFLRCKMSIEQYSTLAYVYSTPKLLFRSKDFAIALWLFFGG